MNNHWFFGYVQSSGAGRVGRRVSAGEVDQADSKVGSLYAPSVLCAQEVWLNGPY